MNATIHKADVQPEPTVFVVDDDPTIRKGLSRLLGTAGYQVASYPSAQEILAQLDSDALGCVLIDLQLPGCSGLVLQERLAERCPELTTVFLTGHGEVPESVRALKAGASDFLQKPVDEAVLLRALETALHESSERARRQQREKETRRRIESLSVREREVMEFVIGGYLNKQIAAELGIAEKTVKVHRGRIMTKMAVRSAAELIHHCAFAGVEPRLRR